MWRQQRRLDRINSRAADVAHQLALRDAKAALRCVDQLERAELRQSAAILTGLAKSLRAREVVG